MERAKHIYGEAGTYVWRGLNIYMERPKHINVAIGTYTCGGQKHIYLEH
jgi:hypothetical protein